jgi:hypothetical protein
MQRMQLLLVKAVGRCTVEEEAAIFWLVKHIVVCCIFKGIAAAAKKAVRTAIPCCIGYSTIVWFSCSSTHCCYWWQAM